MGAFFLKWGDAAGATFAAEAAGLDALREAGSPLVVPAVHAVRAATADSPGALLLDWVEPGKPTADFWTRFGQDLAALHRHTADQYGFAEDNFIGRLPQRNTLHATWPAFVRAERLGPQVTWARERGRWQRAWDTPYEALLDRLDALLPARPPASILHGDLWGGNFLVTTDGSAALVDPAAYHGHREADLAMTELFGGFDERFYAAYRAAWPLEPGYADRRDVYNLYHLLNHLNHFSGSYAGAVDRLLRRFA